MDGGEAPTVPWTRMTRSVLLSQAALTVPCQFRPVSVCEDHDVKIKVHERRQRGLTRTAGDQVAVPDHLRMSP